MSALCARCRNVLERVTELCSDCEFGALEGLEPFSVDRKSFLHGYARAFSELSAWKMHESLARETVKKRSKK